MPDIIDPNRGIIGGTVRATIARLEAERDAERTARKALEAALATEADAAAEATRQVGLREKAYIEVFDQCAVLEAALREIVQWSEAYPLDIFPEPDFGRAHALLRSADMSLDAISASCMRHVVEGVGKIAREALSPSGNGEGT